MLEDSLCRTFSNITWRKQKNAPSNLQTDHKKTDITPQIFQKKLQRIAYLCLCYGQASSWVSSQCKFSHFLGGFAVLQISTSSLLCAGDLGRHGMLHATEIAPHILKPSSKKQMAFKYVVVAVPF